MRSDARFQFPDPRLAAEHGLVAIGGDFRPERLIAAYAHGIFPWPSTELPRAWYSPDPRMVLEPARLHVSRSLRRTLRQGRFEIRYDTAFQRVIRACAEQERDGEVGTWISRELANGFTALHRLGLAHSVETWRDGELVGGLYGISLGSMFSGESMFYLQPNASKIALAALVERIGSWGFELLDCQIHSDHLERLGARLWPRDRFLDTVAAALEHPTRRGPWPAPIVGAIGDAR